MVRSLTCCPTATPARVTPNKTCPPRWFRKAHTVLDPSRRVPVVSLNSSVSDSPAAANAAIHSGVTMALPLSAAHVYLQLRPVVPIGGRIEPPYRVREHHGYGRSSPNTRR